MKSQAGTPPSYASAVLPNSLTVFKLIFVLKCSIFLCFFSVLRSGKKTVGAGSKDSGCDVISLSDSNSEGSAQGDGSSDLGLALSSESEPGFSDMSEGMTQGSTSGEDVPMIAESSRQGQSHFRENVHASAFPAEVREQLDEEEQCLQEYLASSQFPADVREQLLQEEECLREHLYYSCLPPDVREQLLEEETCLLEHLCFSSRPAKVGEQVLQEPTSACGQAPFFAFL